MFFYKHIKKKNEQNAWGLYASGEFGEVGYATLTIQIENLLSKASIFYYFLLEDQTYIQTIRHQLQNYAACHNGSLLLLLLIKLFEPLKFPQWKSENKIFIRISRILELTTPQAYTSIKKDIDN